MNEKGNKKVNSVAVRANQSSPRGQIGKFTGFQRGPVLVAVLILLTALSSTAARRADAEQTFDSLSVKYNQEAGGIPVIDSTTTLAEYLAIAMRRNPGVRSSFHEWTAELKKSEYAGSLPDPLFSYSYFVENVETRVGPQEQRFGLRQSFPWFGTLGAAADAAFAKSQASYQRFQARKFRLFYDVKSAYYDYYYLGQELLITAENLELLTFWESVAQSKYRVGLKQHPDLVKAQVELGILEDRLRTLKEQVDPSAARLKELLDLPDTLHLPLPESLSVIENFLDTEAVAKAVERNNPDLRALSHMVEAQRAGAKLAGKQSMPSFSIGVEYVQTGDALDPSMPESGKDPWMIGASISLPIWFGKNSARKKEAEARSRAAMYNLKESENRLGAITQQLLFEYSDALRKMQLYRDGLVPKGEQSLQAAYAAYQTGETDFLNVLDTQRQLLSFQLTVARERARLATKRAQLEMLSGSELSMYETD